MGQPLGTRNWASESFLLGRVGDRGRDGILLDHVEKGCSPGIPSKHPDFFGYADTPFICGYFLLKTTGVRWGVKSPQVHAQREVRVKKHLIGRYPGDHLTPFLGKAEEASSKPENRQMRMSGPIVGETWWNRTGWRFPGLDIPPPPWSFLENQRVDCPSCCTDQSSWVGALLSLERCRQDWCPWSLATEGVKITV